MDEEQPNHPYWRGLRPRLFLSYMVVTAIALATLAVAASAIAPTLFASHMAGMMSGGWDAAGMGGMMGSSGSGPVGAMGPITAETQASLAAAFRAAFNGALLYAAAAAALAAVGASAFVAHRISIPVRRLSAAARHIASGQYAERVRLPGGAPGDELADLATRFNEMAAALEATEERRLQLVGDVAHELRTPVATLQGYLEGLLDGVVKPDADTFARLHDETGRLSRLIDDLQELSRAEAGRLSLRLRPVLPEEITSAACARLAPAFRVKGVELSVVPSLNLPPVAADLDRAVQVLTNLLSNALRHTPAGGTVEVLARVIGTGGAAVEFSVADTGTGISSEHLSHVFERFYRADVSRSRALGGSGVGLTISRAIIQALGGRVWAESAGPGQGATFRFTLPIAPAATAAPS